MSSIVVTAAGHSRSRTGIAGGVTRLPSMTGQGSVSMSHRPLVGALWREHSAEYIERVSDVTCVEVMFEDLADLNQLPHSLKRLKARGVEILVHGATLSLGSAERPDPRRLARMARVADLVDAPLVSEHVAFVRASEVDSWHVLPLHRTRDTLEVFLENLAEAKELIGRPFAVENVAHLFDWSDHEMDQGTFLREVLVQGDVQLLLDVENLRIDEVNLGMDATHVIDAIPLERLAYVHMAGGAEKDGVAFDTHSAPISRETYHLLESLAERVDVPRVTIERDVQLTSAEELRTELNGINEALARGTARRLERAPG
ncbi:DUF692 family multinuclear iron-containing protein [Actinophytocola glycyrrhizae]|uniref:DUF692 family multinuclear iron-containing protein n=1 Tax=Actinophytocola glycyrrhizae TaxID=2044873 RepID=A0ABV9SC33_9PSEU